MVIAGPDPSHWTSGGFPTKVLPLLPFLLLYVDFEGIPCLPKTDLLKMTSPFFLRQPQKGAVENPT